MFFVALVAERVGSDRTVRQVSPTDVPVIPAARSTAGGLR